MLFEYLSDKPWLHLWLIICGLIITLALLCVVGIFLMEVVKGFIYAVDFQRYKRRVAKHRGRQHKFKLRWFLNGWWHFMGWKVGADTLTSPDGDQYLGLGKWNIRGKFTTVEPAYVPVDEDDDEFDLDDESSNDPKRP